MAEILGQQEPRFSWVPPHLSSAGQEAVDLAALAGLHLDPWQQLVLDGALAETDNFTWTCFEVCVIVSRQNGKGSILEALELAGLFLFGDKLIIHSAHQFNTSKEHFLRMEQLIRNCPDLHSQVEKFSRAHGEEAIILKSGQRLQFMARTGSSGRGFTGDRIIFDEAMYLDAMQMAAMLPTLSTRPNAQVWYTGSAGMKHSDHLAALRRRGIRGGDPSLAFFEWSIDERPVEEGGDDRSDPRSWAKANPSMNIRISQGYIEKEMNAFGGPDSPQFGMERLGVGDWPAEEAAWAIIDQPSWADAANAMSQIDGPLVFGVDADPETRIGSIGVVGMSPSGNMHYEIAHRQAGTAWMAEWLIERCQTWEPLVVCILPTSPAASIVQRLLDAKVKVSLPSQAEYSQACGEFYEDIVERKCGVHLGQSALNKAIGGARKKTLSDGSWVWSRKEAVVDIAPAVAVTLARQGFSEFANRRLKPLGAIDQVVPESRFVRRSEPNTQGAVMLSAARNNVADEIEPFGGFLDGDEIQSIGYSNSGSGGFAAAKRGGG